MKILVLDTIHGGREIGAAYLKAGHDAECVDVYRNSSRIDTDTALKTSYDLIAAPVHLDPDHPLIRSQSVPVITHHAAVRALLPDTLPHPMVEITGRRGKTTTAAALASVLPGPGILQSSSGMIRFPSKTVLARMSITPASVIAAVKAAEGTGGWLVAEESLGVSGAGDLAVLTSAETYLCAGGKKDALSVKIRSLQSCRNVLLAPGVSCDIPHAVRLEDIASVDGTTCRISGRGFSCSFSSDLLMMESYRVPLMLAGAAACIMGFDPSGLAGFPGIPGRMSLEHKGNTMIVDNANSGTDAETTVAAAQYARTFTGSDVLTLVIGMEPGDGKVCEGFPDSEIVSAIGAIRPQRLFLVGNVLNPPVLPADFVAGTCIHRALGLDDGKAAAVRMTDRGSIVLAVKTWR